MPPVFFCPRKWMGLLPSSLSFRGVRKSRTNIPVSVTHQRNPLRPPRNAALFPLSLPPLFCPHLPRSIPPFPSLLRLPSPPPSPSLMKPQASHLPPFITSQEMSGDELTTQPQNHEPLSSGPRLPEVFPSPVAPKEMKLSSKKALQLGGRFTAVSFQLLISKRNAPVLWGRLWSRLRSPRLPS